MPDERAQRRLAAILAADVVGYSRLMQLDEAGTLAALKTRRADVLKPAVAKHRGRIVKFMGDGVLVEFASAVDAVADGGVIKIAPGTTHERFPAREGRRIKLVAPIGDVTIGAR